jgi:hypothetical protein
VPDVQQISAHKLMMRKLSLAFSHIDPVTLSRAFSGLYQVDASTHDTYLTYAICNTPYVFIIYGSVKPAGSERDFFLFIESNNRTENLAESSGTNFYELLRRRKISFAASLFDTYCYYNIYNIFIYIWYMVICAVQYGLSGHRTSQAVGSR